MAKYKVKNTTILHNGKSYGSGSEVELTEDEAKRLGEWVVAVKEKSAPKQAETKTQNKPATKTTNKTEVKKEDEKTEGGNDGK